MLQCIRSCIYSECKSVNTAPLLVLQEDVPYEDLNRTNMDEEMINKSRMVELARSVAVDELSDEVFIYRASVKCLLLSTPEVYLFF